MVTKPAAMLATVRRMLQPAMLPNAAMVPNAMANVFMILNPCWLMPTVGSWVARYLAGYVLLSQNYLPMYTTA